MELEREHEGVVERHRIETERFFAEHRARADRAAFRRLLDREGGEPPRPEDWLPEGWVSLRGQGRASKNFLPLGTMESF